MFDLCEFRLHPRQHLHLAYKPKAIKLVKQLEYIFYNDSTTTTYNTYKYRRLVVNV